MLNTLVDTSGFVPRAQCGTGWTADKILADNLANLLVFTAYVALPVVLLWVFWWVRKALPSPDKKDAVGTDEWKGLLDMHPLSGFPSWVLVVSALFILSCGIGHYWEVLVFRWPAYNLFIAWNVATGVISWVAVFGAWRATKWLSRKFMKLWAAHLADLLAVKAALATEEGLLRDNQTLLDQANARTAQLEELAAKLQAELDARNSGAPRVSWAEARHVTLDKLLIEVREIANIGRPAVTS